MCKTKSRSDWDRLGPVMSGAESGPGGLHPSYGDLELRIGAVVKGRRRSQRGGALRAMLFSWHGDGGIIISGGGGTRV